MITEHTETPHTEENLLARCRTIEGLSFQQLAAALRVQIPQNPKERKGWAGGLIEMALGATAGSRALPDFHHLGIELKSIPMNHLGKPAESTFVTVISLTTIHQETWKTSQCYAKLQRVLWVPVEGDKLIPYPHRRIGRAVLWSPSPEEEAILASDWEELTLLITTGRLAEINATLGHALQIRPKGLNAKSLSYGFDEEGNKIQTLPRGFYLRSKFTASLLSKTQI